VGSWLVTGGCGFIGAHLAEALLARGERVRVLDDLSGGRKPDLPGMDLVVGDVTDRHTVARAMEGVDGVFHLAAVASVERCKEDWLGCHRTNLTGTLAVFDAARRAKPRSPLPVVYASSAAVYGDGEQLPLRETDRASPLSPYGADKLGCELHAQIAWSLYGVANIGLRFFNVYGPGQDPQSRYAGVIAAFAHRAAKRAPLEIFGDGRQTRDFVFVGDVVAHLLAAMEKIGSGSRTFNVCTGRATTVLELARITALILGYTGPVLHLPERPGEIRASVGDPSLSRRELGIDASVTLRDGLRRTLGSIVQQGAVHASGGATGSPNTRPDRQSSALR